MAVTTLDSSCPGSTSFTGCVESGQLLSITSGTRIPHSIFLRRTPLDRIAATPYAAALHFHPDLDRGCGHVARLCGADGGVASAGAGGLPPRRQGACPHAGEVDV